MARLSGRFKRLRYTVSLGLMSRQPAPLEPLPCVYAKNYLTQTTTGLTPFQCILGYRPPLFSWTEEPSDIQAVDHWFRARELGLSSCPTPASSAETQDLCRCPPVFHPHLLSWRWGLALHPGSASPSVSNSLHGIVSIHHSMFHSSSLSLPLSQNPTIPQYLLLLKSSRRPPSPQGTGYLGLSATGWSPGISDWLGGIWPEERSNVDCKQCSYPSSPPLHASAVPFGSPGKGKMHYHSGKP